MTTSRSIGSQKADQVARSRRAPYGSCRNSVLAALVLVALLASSMLLFAQHSSTGTASLGVSVAPGLQLTTNGSTNVSLWIRLGTGNGYLWGDSSSTCTTPIGTATTYTASGKYNSIPLSSVPFTTANTYVCAYDPGATIASAFVVWPHTPASLEFGQQPTTATSGASIAPPVTVKVLDSNGLLDTGSTASVTLAIGTNPGGGTLSGTVTQSAVNGVATFSNLSITKAGTGYTLSATSTGLTSTTSSPFNISAAAATHLVYTTVPGTGTAGTAFSVTVQSQDANGNPSSPTSNTTITLSKATGGGTLSGTLTGSILTSGNSVTIATPVYSKSDTMTLTATATAGETSLTAVTSGNIVFSAGAATKLVYTTVPSTGTAGTAFSVTVQSQDANGNPSSPTSNTTITLSKATGGGTLSGTLTGSILTSGNSVTIATPIYSKSDTMTLTATATAGETSLTAVTSGNIVFSAGAATKLVYTTVPSTGTAGTAFSVTVQSQDANGNPSSPTSNTTITLSKATGGGTLSGTLTGSILTSGNSVTIATPIYSKSDTMTLTATATAGETSLTAVTSGNIVFSAGAATQLAFTTQPGGGTGGTVWTTQPVVTLEDANGNTVMGTAQNVTLAIQNNAGPGGVLSGTTTVAVNTSTGLATFSGLSINKAGTGYTLTATGSTVDTSAGTVVSSAFNIAVGTATQFVITGTGTQTAGGSQTITITAEDAGGNTVTSYTGGHSLTFSGAHASPNPVTIPMVNATNFGTSTSVTFTSGVSTAGRAMVLYDAETATVSVTDGSISSSAAGNLTVVVSAAAANKLVWGQQPPSAVTRGTTISPAMTVFVEDQFGNPASSASNVVLTFNVNFSPGGSDAIQSGSTTSVPVVGGTATFSNMAISGNKTGTGSTFTATLNGITSVNSSAFAVQ